MMHYPVLFEENGCEVERETIQLANHRYLRPIFILLHWDDNSDLINQINK